MNAYGRARREWVAYSNSYLSGEMRVGEMTVPDGVRIPIMSLPNRFHRDVGGTRDAYGPDLGRESLFGSPSSSMIWRRSPYARLVGWAYADGGCPPFRFPFGEEGMGAVALSLARVGACADELRLLGVERDEITTEMDSASGAEGSLSRKSSRACGPPAMKRM